MSRSSSRQIKTFPQGGVHPPDNKLSFDLPITDLPLSEKVAIPLSQHIGAPAEVVVAVNDEVKAGQLIASSKGFISTNIHSSVSGVVEKIEPVMDNTGYKRDAVIIKVEGDTWAEGIDRTQDIVRDIKLGPQEIRDKVLECGVVGLGGATFPAHVKLSVPEGRTVEFLLINGVECEPYLTSDHRMMLEKGEEMIIGVKIMLKALGVEKALIGIEENKPDAIEKLRDLVKDDERIEVHALKVQYPQGGERQLVKALVNREIPPPPQGLPIDAACVVFNVATAFAVYEAVQKNKPLVERVVTVTGPLVKKPCNFRARIGTSLREIIDQSGGLPEGTGKVINGGPMMGKAVASIDIPMTKGIGGILILPQDISMRKEVIECIRCAKCVSVCPLGLEPYLLMTLSDKKLFERAQQERITNCCECACCAYTCPSSRPLLDYIRLGKTIVLQKMREQNKK